MTILQTVSIFAPGSPAAPFVKRAADGGWHFDCGNCAGWSIHYPSACKCGHCLPTYEAIRASAPEAVVCRCGHNRGSHYGFELCFCDVMLNSGHCRCAGFNTAG